MDVRPLSKLSAIVVTLAIVLAACTSTDAPPGPGGEVAAGGSTTLSVTLSDFAIEPSSLEADAGTELSIDVENHGATSHTFAVVAGGTTYETPTSAALELARTILRRAERRAVSLQRAGNIPGPHLVPYLNRLADLVWVLARAAERAESRAATPARTPGVATRRETSR